MLVLTRGPKDKVVFPHLGITVEILRVNGNRVRLGIDAPKDVTVLRHELADSLSAELQAAADEQGQTADHLLRNRLNVAQMAIGLAQKQLDAGQLESALTTLHRAIRSFETLDSEFANPEQDEQAASGEPSRRALLVEDDANECELLAGFLRMSGFEVDTAVDGMQAIVYLSRNCPPDVVLMDMHMPGFSGMRAVRIIRENPDYRNLRLFGVSGSTPDAVDLDVGPGGVDRWFRKPVDPQNLIEAINRDIDADQHVPTHCA